jgi:hypothetical protein
MNHFDRQKPRNKTSISSIRYSYITVVPKALAVVIRLIGVAYSTHGSDEKLTVLAENMEGKSHLEDMGG